MLGLLSYYLQRIDTLQMFYDTQLKAIERISKKKRKENRFAMLSHVYLGILTFGTDKDKTTKSFKALENVMKDCIEIKNISDKNGKKEIAFSLKDNPYFGNVKNIDVKAGALEYTQYSDLPNIHAANTLIMLLIRFEDFVSNHIRKMFSKFPEKYLNEKSISLAEINDLGINEIKEVVLTKEVEKTMRLSHTEWFKIYVSHKMNFDNYNDELEILKELYARRNILVHNSGKVNKDYLSLVSTCKYKLGDELTVDDEYLKQAFSTIKELIFAIIIESQRFYKISESNLLDEAFEKGFEEMLKESYDIGEKVYFSLKTNPLLSEEDKLVSKVNYWICKKELDGLQEIKGELQSFDATALKEIYVLAKHLLLEDNHNSFLMTEELLKKNQINASIINEWPLFKRFRKTKEYQMLKSNDSAFFDLTTIEADSKAVEKAPSSLRSELNEVKKQ